MARDLDATFYTPVSVVLPRDPDSLSLQIRAPGTAFVTYPHVVDGHQFVYHEESREHSDATFTDRVLIAHGRAWSAGADTPGQRRDGSDKRTAVATDSVLTIGSYDPREGEITLHADPDARQRLIAWLGLWDAPGVDTLLAAELQSSAVKHLTRRELRRALANPAMRHHPAVRQLARRHGHEDLLGAQPDPRAQTPPNNNENRMPDRRQRLTHLRDLADKHTTPSCGRGDIEALLQQPASDPDAIECPRFVALCEFNNERTLFCDDSLDELIATLTELAFGAIRERPEGDHRPRHQHPPRRDQQRRDDLHPAAPQLRGAAARAPRRR